MDALRAPHLNWRLRRLSRGMDWTLTLALGLAAFGAAFYFSTVAPALAYKAELRERFAHLRAASSPLAEDVRDARDPHADLVTFYASLAQPGKVPDMLRRLHRAAADQGLVVEQSEYRPLPDPAGRLVRYQILLPARGSYPQVRRFLAQATRELPALAVDGVTFQRQQVGDELLDAQVKLTLFVQGRAEAIPENLR